MESDSDTCLPSENRVLMAAVRPQLADSFTGMGGWEGLCQVQEVGLENFSSPFHLHLMCSCSSHWFLSWLAGLGALVFGLCCAQSHSSEHYLELLVTRMSIMASSPWMLCLTTSWGAGSGMENKNHVFPPVHARRRAGRVPQVMRNSKFWDEFPEIFCHILYNWIIFNFTETCFMTQNIAYKS